MADSLPTEGHVFWDTPELVSFMQAARACYIAGEDYDTLKDIIATVDELVNSACFTPGSACSFSKLCRYHEASFCGVS